MLNRIFVLSVLLCRINGSKILAIFPTPLYSHQSVFQPVWKELSLRGHNVTVITTNPLNDVTLSNLTEIDVGFLSRFLLDAHNFSQVINTEKSLMTLVEYVSRLSLNVTEEQLRHPDVGALLKSNDTFDLVIVENGTPLWYSFGEKYKCPLIGITSMDASFITHEFLGNPAHPILYPDFNLPFGPKLDFIERVTSVLFSLYIRYKHYKDIYTKFHSLSVKYLGYFSKLQELEKNFSLLFVNTLPGFHRSRPLVPNVIELNGLHIKPPKRLDEELQLYLDSANSGLIYFSLGSNVKCNFIPKWKLEAILEAFAELPYKVLWKFDSGAKVKTHNVRTEPWLPQQDVLRHPNVKLFITQGGLQSMDEAIRFKVPLLGIPFFGDQFHNVKKIKHLGIGLEINFEEFTKESFLKAIVEIISNNTYRSRMEQLSSLVGDQPVKPLDKAIWWIEYVIRHKGAQHLQSPAVRMPFYQYYLLDVVAFLLALFVCFAYVALRFIKSIARAHKNLLSRSNKTKPYKTD